MGGAPRVPLDRVAAAPVPVGLRAVRSAAVSTSPVLCGVPRTFATSQFGPRWAARIARVGLEAARPRGPPRRRAQLRRAPSAARTTTPRRDRRAAHEVLDRRLVAHARSRARSAAARCCVHEPAPAVDRADGEPAPEPVAPVDLVAPGARTSAGTARRVRRSQRDGVARVADQHARPSRRRRGRASRVACRPRNRPRCTGSRSVPAAARLLDELAHVLERRRGRCGSRPR